MGACCNVYVQVYERADSFRAQIGNLELIVGLYNDIQRTMMPVEKPLIQGKLDTVDAALRKGLQVRMAFRGSFAKRSSPCE